MIANTFYLYFIFNFDSSNIAVFDIKGFCIFSNLSPPPPMKMLLHY